MKNAELFSSLVAALFLAACSRAPQAPVAKGPSSTPAAIVEVSGGKQVSTVGTPLDQPVVVQVNNAQGAPVAGASIWFRSARDVVFQPASGVTGADGQFTFAVTLGSMAGRYQISATTLGAAGKTIELHIDELALGYEENQGRQLSDLYCARCHDSESTPERVSNHDNLVAQAHALNDGATLNKMSDAELVSIIEHGGPGLDRSAEMPPYGHTLNKRSILALVAYIRAIADPPFQLREVVYAQR